MARLCASDILKGTFPEDEIKERIMKTFANLTEPQIIDKIKKLINVAKISGLRKIDKGAVLKGLRFRETIEKHYRGKLLWPLIEADLILIFEGYKEFIDRNLIVAVEIKYFTPKVAADKQLSPLQAALFALALRNRFRR